MDQGGEILSRCVFKLVRGYLNIDASGFLVLVLSGVRESSILL